MAKENLSRKLVTRCAAAALAVAVTLTCYTGSSSSSSPEIEIASQDEVSQSSETEYSSSTAETVALTMATYGASQGVTTSLVSAESQGTVTTTAQTTASESSTTASTTASSAGTTTTKSTTTKSAKKAKSNNYVYTTTTAQTTTAASETTAFKIGGDIEEGGQEESADLAKPQLLAEKTYETDYTHPYNHQTNQIRLHWNAVEGAVKYMVFVKGGQYADWKNIVVTSSLEYTVTGLRRDTSYSFVIKAVDADGNASPVSAVQDIKTARMDYSAAGWQAMCRIVFHEVGGAAGSFWDKPIVYVADCVANQYVCAKYTKQGTWAKYYSRYSNIESIIYTSGGFLSDAGLTARGATYSRVTKRVKLAVWGAVYGVTAYNNIANDYNVFYWCNSGSYKSSSKVAYNFKLPWGGYMQIWRQYWG